MTEIDDVGLLTKSAVAASGLGGVWCHRRPGRPRSHPGDSSMAPHQHIMQSPSVMIGLDLSNIHIGRAHAARAHREGPGDVRLSVEKLAGLAADGRPIERAVAVVSALTPRDVVRHYSDHFEIVRVEPGVLSRREVAGDELLQNRLLYALSASRDPGVLVLLTGDGAGGERGIGFRPLVAEARRRGWGVELISWRATTNAKLGDLVGLVGVTVALDDYYYGITFVQGGRRPQGVVPGYRPRAVPQPYALAERQGVGSLVAAWRAGHGAGQAT